MMKTKMASFYWRSESATEGDRVMNHVWSGCILYSLSCTLCANEYDVVTIYTQWSFQVIAIVLSSNVIYVHVIHVHIFAD